MMPVLSQMSGDAAAHVSFAAQHSSAAHVAAAHAPVLIECSPNSHVPGHDLFG
jgi:hypothetical protein